MAASLALAACGPKPAPPHPLENAQPHEAPKPVAASACPEVEKAKVTPANAGVGAIAGVVQDAACQLVVGATVIASSPSLPGQQVGISDETGRFLIDPLPSGTYTVTVYYGDGQQRVDHIEVTAGAAAHVQVRMSLPPDVNINVISKPPYGAPPARRRVV